MDVSVIVASVEAEHCIRDCIASILTTARSRKVEVIVADASLDDSAGVVRLSFPDAKLITMKPGTLTPNLWSEGLAHSNGRAVAFTTAHHVVPQAWIAELCSGLESGAAAAGGPIALEQRSTLLDAAIYFLRYSAFMPEATTESHESTEIPGDNSIYRREVIARHESALRDGFWEVELHQLLRVEGEHIRMIPRATITFGRSVPLGLISRQRFAHGKHFGRWRASQPSHSRVRIIALAPLVPFVLLARVARRVNRANGRLGLFIRCSPIFLWLAACWAFGEAVGATDSVQSDYANRR